MDKKLRKKSFFEIISDKLLQFVILRRLTQIWSKTVNYAETWEKTFFENCRFD